MKQRLIFLVVSFVFLVSCAHTKLAGVRPGAGQRFYYSETDFLNYEVIGEGEIPLIFLHGFGASLRTWDDVLSCIPKDRFTAYLIDLKGFGLSSKPHDPCYSIKDNADLVCRFILEKKLNNFVLVGHSLGGAIALALAVESLSNELLNPGAMVLIDVAAYKTKPPFFVKFLRIPVVGRLLLSLTGSEFKARFVLKRIIYDHRKITPFLIDRYAAFMDIEGHDYTLLKTSAHLLADDYEWYRGKYHQIPYPALVIWGAQDTAIPLSSGEQLIVDLPKAKMHTIQKCGHNPHEEFPEEVAALIIAAALDALKGGHP